MSQDDELLLMGEQLKSPLINILQLAELGDKDVIIKTQAQKALNTIDNMLLYRRLVSGQQQLQLEPVHVGSTIADVAAAMEPQMKMSGCQSELIIQSSLQPADVDRRVLHAALTSLWQAFVASLQSPQPIICSAQKISSGVRVTILSSGIDLEDFSVASTNATSSQPLTGVAGAATDYITAHSMFGLVGGKLTKTRRGQMAGLGVTLPASLQLQLV